VLPTFVTTPMNCFAWKHVSAEQLGSLRKTKDGMGSEAKPEVKRALNTIFMVPQVRNPVCSTVANQILNALFSFVQDPSLGWKSDHDSLLAARNEPLWDILSDLYFYLYGFCIEQALSAEQTSAMMSIVKHMLDHDLLFTSVEIGVSFSRFRKILFQHAVDRKPYSSALFTEDQAQAALEYWMETYYRHFNLYSYNFTKPPNPSFEQRSPSGVDEIKKPRPLNEAMVCGKDEHHFSKTSQMALALAHKTHTHHKAFEAVDALSAAEAAENEGKKGKKKGKDESDTPTKPLLGVVGLWSMGHGHPEQASGEEQPVLVDPGEEAAEKAGEESSGSDDDGGEGDGHAHHGRVVDHMMESPGKRRRQKFLREYRGKKSNQSGSSEDLKVNLSGCVHDMGEYTSAHDHLKSCDHFDSDDEVEEIKKTMKGVINTDIVWQWRWSCPRKSMWVCFSEENSRKLEQIYQGARFYGDPRNTGTGVDVPIVDLGWKTLKHVFLDTMSLTSVTGGRPTAMHRCSTNPESDRRAYFREAKKYSRKCVPVAQHAMYSALQHLAEAEMEIKRAKQRKASQSGSLKLMLQLREVRKTLHMKTIHDIQRRVEAMIESNGGAPLITVDLINRRVNMSEQIQFEGGKAIIKEISEPLLNQLAMALDCVVTTIAEFHVDDLHFRVEGHVNPVKKSADGGMGVSKARAKAVVMGLMRGGVPLKILHSKGCGAKFPLGDSSKNRRVEIHVMDTDELNAIMGRMDQERAGAMGFGA
jgi:outer membrane protein OmpA-like peptidoglycan-associated protein